MGSKLCQVVSKKLRSIYVIMLNVGSADFRANFQEGFNGKYMEYIDEIIANYLKLSQSHYFDIKHNT